MQNKRIEFNKYLLNISIEYSTRGWELKGLQIRTKEYPKSEDFNSLRGFEFCFFLGNCLNNIDFYFITTNSQWFQFSKHLLHFQGSLQFSGFSSSLSMNVNRIWADLCRTSNI